MFKANNAAAKARGNLTNSQLKSIYSIGKQIVKHESKLAIHKKSNEIDRQRFLRNVPSNTVRQQIIQSGLNHPQQ